jgi:hypothetical protein
MYGLTGCILPTIPGGTGNTMNQQRRRRADSDVTGEFCQRFGAVAVHQGFVTMEEVKTAISEQVDDDIGGREHRLLGSILYDKGLITEHQIEVVLLEIRKTMK